MIQTLWSSWPGLGTHINPHTLIQSTHQIEANLISLLPQIKFHFAWCPWLVCLCACNACVLTCVSVLVYRGVLPVSDERWWVSLNKIWGCWKAPSCWQNSNPPQGSLLLGFWSRASARWDQRWRSDLEWLCTVAAVCVFVFAHLCVSIIFWSSGWMWGIRLPVGQASI